MNPFLFVTDLDNTLVGDDRALEVLNQQLEAHRQQWGTKIVYATGRSPFLYRQLAREKPLLPPDALILSVGTEVYLEPAKEIPDSEWEAILAQGWERDKIVAIANDYQELELQPDTEQNTYKISFYIDQSVAAKILPQLEKELSQSFAIKLIYSGGQDLDILPANGDKGLAVQFLRQKLAIEASKTVVCGDSGNDIALFQGEERGIMVGNAKPELRKWYEENRKETHYLAKAECAGGILEGLQYFGFLASVS